MYNKFTTIYKRDSPSKESYINGYTVMFYTGIERFELT